MREELDGCIDGVAIFIWEDAHQSFADPAMSLRVFQLSSDCINHTSTVSWGQVIQRWQQFQPQRKRILFALAPRIIRPTITVQLRIEIADLNAALRTPNLRWGRIDKNTMKLLILPRLYISDTLPSRCDNWCSLLFLAHTVTPHPFCIVHTLPRDTARDCHLGSSTGRPPRDQRRGTHWPWGIRSARNMQLPNSS